MVSTLHSRLIDSGSSPGRGTCSWVLFFWGQDTYNLTVPLSIQGWFVQKPGNTNPG